MVGQMAARSEPGKSNPDWIWDEQILAFDTYLKHDGVPPKGHHSIVELSEILRSLPIHPLELRSPTFRNPNGVGRKLADIHTHRPGYKGKPTSGSKLDTEIWKLYGNNLQTVSAIAKTIRVDYQSLQFPVDDEEEIANTHHEGRIVVRLHKTRERDRRIVMKKKASVLQQNGSLSCEACGINLEKTYGSEKFDVYECHHLLPLHVSGDTKTNIEDLALLCPTCHRIAHRITPWPTVTDLKKIVSP